MRGRRDAKKSAKRRKKRKEALCLSGGPRQCYPDATPRGVFEKHTDNTVFCKQTTTNTDKTHQLCGRCKPHTSCWRNQGSHPSHAQKSRRVTHSPVKRTETLSSLVMIPQKAPYSSPIISHFRWPIRNVIQFATKLIVPRVCTHKPRRIERRNRIMIAGLKVHRTRS
jgi:hypothetical protein